MKGNGHHVSGLRLLDADDEGGDEGTNDAIGATVGEPVAGTSNRPRGDVADLIAFVLGAIGLAVEALTEAIRQAGPHEAAPGDDTVGLMSMAASTGLGLTAGVARRAAGVADRAISAAAPTVRCAVRSMKPNVAVPSRSPLARDIRRTGPG